jgi:hypothetical protein
MRFAKHLLKYLFSDMRLEVPLDWLAVISSDTFKEFARDTADHFRLTVIGSAETAGHHTAEVMTRIDEGDLESFSRSRNSRGYARRGGAVDYEIELVGLG